jgi:hypothetical protein
MPRRKPWLEMASSAYAEHEGTNLHDAGSSGDTAMR